MNVMVWSTFFPIRSFDPRAAAWDMMSGSMILRYDSEYVVKGVNERRKNWERMGLESRPNADLWVLLFREVDAHPGMRLEWVRGHARDRLNNEVDNLARTTAERIRDGKPVANQPHPFITATVGKLESYIAKFQPLAEVDAEVEIESAFKLMGAKADRWFPAPHPRLGEPPIDLLLRGESHGRVCHKHSGEDEPHGE